MATGDVTWFDQGLLDLGLKKHNLGSDVFKLGIVTGVTPTGATADPRWGSGGTTNYSSSQVSTGGTSYTGPITLSGVSWSIEAGTPTFDATNVTISQDGSGFTNGRWGIVYNDTSAGKEALAFVDLGADRSIQSGPLSINWNAGGILTLDQA